jgi:GTP-binding protein YchF
MLRAGLIGLPSSGKTTLFQLMTSAREAPRTHGKAEANVGISRVPDDRLDQLTVLFQPERRVPATVEFADMAAVRSETKALLDVAAYRNADALLHVVRAFRDPSVPHPKESIDPLRDAQLIEEELVLADLGVAERRLERLEKDLKKSQAPELKKEQDLLLRCQTTLEAGKALRTLGLAGEDLKRLRGFQFLSAKPLLLVLNIDEADIAGADRAATTMGLAPWLDATRAAVVAVCAKIELEIAQLDPADARAFLADLGLKESGLDRVIRAAYELLGYISFFTVGDDECRAWSIPRGTSAQEAAGTIHTDIQRGFIRAEVVPYDRLLEQAPDSPTSRASTLRGEPVEPRGPRALTACREHGELRLEGKDYEVVDGDVITFRHAT